MSDTEIDGLRFELRDTMFRLHQTLESNADLVKWAGHWQTARDEAVADADHMAERLDETLARQDELVAEIEDLREQLAGKERAA